MGLHLLPPLFSASPRQKAASAEAPAGEGVGEEEGGRLERWGACTPESDSAADPWAVPDGARQHLNGEQLSRGRGSAPVSPARLKLLLLRSLEGLLSFQPWLLASFCSELRSSCLMSRFTSGLNSLVLSCRVSWIFSLLIHSSSASVKGKLYFLLFLFCFSVVWLVISALSPRTASAVLRGK